MQPISYFEQSENKLRLIGATNGFSSEFFFFFEDIIFLGSQKKGTIAYCLKTRWVAHLQFIFLVCTLWHKVYILFPWSVPIEINITSAFSKIKVTWTPLSQAELRVIRTALSQLACPEEH